MSGFYSGTFYTYAVINNEIDYADPVAAKYLVVDGAPIVDPTPNQQGVARQIYSPICHSASGVGG